jgi:hypothetical protein
VIPAQALDPLPVPLVFVLFAIVSLVAYEICFRIGRWHQNRTPDEKEGPAPMLVGSLLALMGFLLAVTIGMASDRFDNRRGLVLDEANAIGTLYLRAGYLPQPASDESRALLRAYAPLRVNTADADALQDNLTQSNAIQSQLWAIAEPLAKADEGSEMLALYVDALNQLIDLGETRTTALVYARVPESVILLTFGGSALTLGMVGYTAGLTRRRSVLTAVVLVVVLGAVITLIVDLDRPTEGFLQVSQQPIIDAINMMANPPPGATATP